MTTLIAFLLFFIALGAVTLFFRYLKKHPIQYDKDLLYPEDL